MRGCPTEPGFMKTVFSYYASEDIHPDKNMTYYEEDEYAPKNIVIITIINIGKGVRS